MHPNSIANLTHFSSTYQPAKRGRRPNRFKKYLKFEGGWSYEDVGAMSTFLLHLKHEELVKLAKDGRAPWWMMTCANLLVKELLKGKNDTVRWLTERATGATRQYVEVKGEMDITTMTAEERKARIAELLAARRAQEEQGDKPETT